MRVSKAIRHERRALDLRVSGSGLRAFGLQALKGRGLGDSARRIVTMSSASPWPSFVVERNEPSVGSGFILFEVGSETEA